MTLRRTIGVYLDADGAWAAHAWSESGVCLKWNDNFARMSPPKLSDIDGLTYKFTRFACPIG
jgi:hypothetical protein